MLVAVIPAYNEATRIRAVVRDAARHVQRVIVVDDGSSDGTGTAAREEGATVIRHTQNGGAGAATMTGLEAARRMGAEAVVTLDADEQHDPQEIPELLEPILAGRADIVFANRFGRRKRGGKHPNKIPGIRRFFNAAGNLITFAATGLLVADSQCGFKVFGPKALKEIQLRMSGFEFCTEIVRETSRHRWRMEQVPVKVMYSEYTLAKGQSFAGGVKTALKILIRSFLR